MKLFFEPTPFYNADCEKHIPVLEDCKKHFFQLYAEYSRLGAICEKGYNDRFSNLITYTSGKGEIVEQLTTDQYYNLSKEYHRLKDYYSLLLNAVRRVHDFWLNDLLPEQPRKKRKNK